MPGPWGDPSATSTRLLKGDFAKALAVRPKPRYCLANAFAQIMSRLKSKQLPRLAHIQAASRLSVWFGLIPDNPPGEADFRRDHLRQLANGDFLACPQVDRLVPIVALR